MGGVKSDLLGTEPGPSFRPGGDPVAPGVGFDSPGPIGRGDAPVPLASRIIAKVTKDWDPPNSRTTPEIVVNGATLAAAARELNTLPEWGQAGGSLRTDAIPGGNSTNLTVNLHGNLVYRLPRWTGYARASTAAKAEWDRMFAKLARSRGPAPRHRDRGRGSARPRSHRARHRRHCEHGDRRPTGA